MTDSIPDAPQDATERAAEVVARVITPCDEPDAFDRKVARNVLAALREQPELLLDLLVEQGVLSKVANGESHWMYGSPLPRVYVREVQS